MKKREREASMAELKGATRRLGEFVVRCIDAPLPPKVADKAAFCLLDALALAIIAREERTSAAMRAIVTPLEDQKATARIWVDGTRTVVSEAITANAIAVHAHFHDDTDYSSWTHPGSLIVPVAVSLGEATDAPLDIVLRGIIAGYDTLIWLGANERVARAMISRGIRTSPTLGTIGAAATAAVMLELNAVQAINTIGIASSITGGVLEPVRVGSDEWRVQNAHAARGGLLAAQMGQRGVTGAANGLEGPKGLMRSFAGLDDVPPEWNDAPGIEAILEIVAKPWATLGDNMAAAVAAKLIYDDGVDIKNIERIITRIWRPYAEYPGTSYRGPFEQTAQALASTVFATSAMLVYGKLEYDISLNRRRDPEILRLARLTSIEANEEGGPADGSVEVVLSDGTTLRRTSREAPRTLLYHDRPRAIEVFEERLTRCGRAIGTGSDIAGGVFASLDQGTAVGIRNVLDNVIAG